MSRGVKWDVAASRHVQLKARAVLFAGAVIALHGTGAQAQPTPPPAQPARTLLGMAPAARSDSPAWFNLKTPGPESDPTAGVVQIHGLDLPHQPTTFPPGPHDPRLSGAAIKQDLKQIVGFSLQSRARGEYLWGRVTGRPDYDATTAWVLEELKKAGLRDAHLETFTAPPIHLPVAGEVRLVGDEAFGAGSRDIVLQSAMVGGSGPVNGAVTAPLIYLAQATDADLAGRDVRGKIAIVNATPNPGLYSSNEYGRLQAMIDAGAVGAIEILQQPGNMKSYDRDRHGCGTGLCFTVGGEDGYFLQNTMGAAAKAGKTVTARLSATSETLRDAAVSNVVATIPGRSNRTVTTNFLRNMLGAAAKAGRTVTARRSATSETGPDAAAENVAATTASRSDRTIIINAHADGWFTAADDNGSGLATLLALARHFAAQPQPERTLVFVASAGHHTPANGLAAFRQAHDGDYVAAADLIINLEHVAVSGMMRSMVEQQDNNFGRKMLATSTELPKQVGVNNQAPFLIDIWRQGVKCFGLSTQRVVDRRNPGELGRFAELPVAQTQMISAGPVYHTSGETVDTIPDEGLERAARFHAYMIAESAKAPAELLRGGPWAPRASCPPTP